jgi:hypothetical protein
MYTLIKNQNYLPDPTTHLFAIFIPFCPEEAGIVQPKQLERILIDGILQLLV